MGNKPQVQLPPVSDEALEQSCVFFSNHQGLTFTKVEVLEPIKTILQSIREKQPLQKKEAGIQVNRSILKLVFSPYFSKQIMKLVQLFVTQLEQVNKKSLTFLKIQYIMELSSIADFILYFSNEKILQTFDTLLVRSDINEQAKTLLKDLSKLQDGQLQDNGNIVEKMNVDEQEIVQKCLRVTIMNFINLRLKPFSRSQSSLKYFTYFQQSLFMLYSKIYFARHGSNKEPNLSVLNQHFKSNLTIGSYFLSSGTSYIIPSLFQAAVVFLYSFLKVKQIEYKQSKPLASHMFKNLPIIATHSMYEYIITNLLFTLKYIKENNQVYIRFSFNRIMSLKLVEHLLKITKVHTKTITYFLEQLCLQVKIGQIERACVAQIVEIYSKLDPPTTNTQLFTKFLQSSNIKYNLKFTNRQIKISKEELLTELEDEDDTCRKQYYVASYKFVLERVLGKNVNFVFNDRLLWQEILPNLMNSKEDEDVRKSQRIYKGDGYSSDSEEEDSKVEKIKKYGLQEQESNIQKKEHVSVLDPDEQANKVEKVE